MAGLEIHEIQPIKFGGNPASLANKTLLPDSIHDAYTVWWNQLQYGLEVGIP